MKSIIFALTSALVVGCAGTPPADTLEKKLFALEVAWQNTLELVQKNAGRLSSAQKASARERLVDGQRALEAARLAVAVGDEVDFADKAAAINSALSVLRALLEQLEQTETTEIEPCREHRTLLSCLT